MRTLNASLPFSGGSPVSHFQSAKAFAFSIAKSGNKFVEPELIAWGSRSTAISSPAGNSYFGPNGWHDDGVSCVPLDGWTGRLT